MKLQKIVVSLSLAVRTGQDKLDAEVRNGYVSDLMSDVIAHAKERELWITLQTHVNIAAVAGMKGLAGIVLVQGREPEQDTVEKAGKEGIPILVTKMSAFETAGRLYNILNAEEV